MKANGLESEFFEGFYHVPDMERLLIDRDGHVLDLRLMACVLQTPTRYQYPVVHITGIGTLHIHRLLALTFIPLIDEPSKIQVNHKNGDKHDNRLKNLEWVYPSDNINHAYKTGLRTENTPVKCKDLKTGEVRRFDSISQCSRYLGVGVFVLVKYLNTPTIYPFDMRYEIVKEDEEWKGLSMDVTLKPGFKRTTVVCVPEKDGDVYIFDSAEEASRYTGVSITGVHRSLHQKEKKPVDGHFFYRLESFSGDLENSTRIAGTVGKRQPNRPRYPIVVTDTSNGLVTEWDCAESFAFAIGVSKSAIQKSINRNDGYWKHYHIVYKNKSSVWETA